MILKTLASKDIEPSEYMKHPVYRSDTNRKIGQVVDVEDLGDEYELSIMVVPSEVADWFGTEEDDVYYLVSKEAEK